MFVVACYVGGFVLLWERDQLCNRMRIRCHVLWQIGAKRSRRRKIEGKGERKLSPKGKWRRKVKDRNGNRRWRWSKEK